MTHLMTSSEDTSRSAAYDNYLRRLNSRQAMEFFMIAFQTAGNWC